MRARGLPLRALRDRLSFYRANHRLLPADISGAFAPPYDSIFIGIADPDDSPLLARYRRTFTDTGLPYDLI